MKKKIIVLISLLIQLSTNAQWIKQLNVGAEPFFINKNTGWAVNGTTLYKTINSGSSWLNISIPKFFNSVFFIDEMVGYAASISYEPPYKFYTSRVFISSDGGASWNKLREGLTSELRSVYFINKDIGWACYDTLFHTTDGGKTWSAQFTNDGDIQSVYFIDSYNGFLLTRKGYYYSTSDRGIHWEFHNSPKFYTVSFISPKTGFASKPGATYKTIDGGINWIQISSVGSGRKIKFFDENNALLFNETWNQLLKSENGGKSWFELLPPAVSEYPPMAGFEATDMENLWIYNQASVFKKDTTGTVTLIKPKGGETLYSGFNYEIQWTAQNPEGKTATLEYSLDGGASWQKIVDSVQIIEQKFLWNIPTISNSYKCLVRIKENAHGYSDVSDSTFSIVEEKRKIIITHPKGGELFRNNSNITVSWDANYATNSNALVQLTWGNGSIAQVALAKKMVTISAPNISSISVMKVKIWDEDNPQIFTYSDSFTIKDNPRFYFERPGLNNVWPKDSLMTIRFLSTNVQTIKIEYSTDAGITWMLINTSVEADSNKQMYIDYQWRVPDLSSKNCLLRITDLNHLGVFLVSDRFEITNKEVTGSFPLAIGNKWFYKYGYSYNEPVKLTGIQAIWIDTDTVRLNDGKVYHQINIQGRTNQDKYIFSTYDTLYLRQEKNTLFVKQFGPSDNFNPAMNFTLSYFSYSSLDSSNIFNKLLGSYRIGYAFAAHNITDSIGFSWYNWREQRHGYGGFISSLSGCILNGKKYGEILTDNIVGINEQQHIIPLTFSLSQNYPNPFNPTTTINYSIPEVNLPSREGNGRGVLVTLKVYDMIGREIATLVNETKSPGSYETTFNGASLPSGVYFYTMQCGSFTETKKLILMK